MYHILLFHAQANILLFHAQANIKLDQQPSRLQKHNKT